MNRESDLARIFEHAVSEAMAREEVMVALAADNRLTAEDLRQALTSAADQLWAAVAKDRLKFLESTQDDPIEDQYRHLQMRLLESAIVPWLLSYLDRIEPSNGLDILLISHASSDAAGPLDERFVMTSAQRQLESLILSRQSGAAIGVSGAPGSGKTTLLESIARQPPLHGPHGSTVLIEVDEDMTPRELVLSLIGVLCDNVLRQSSIPRNAHPFGLTGRRRPDAVGQLWPIPFFVGLVLFGLKVLGVDLTTQDAVTVGLLVAGAIGLASRLASMFKSRGEARDWAGKGRWWRSLTARKNPYKVLVPYASRLLEMVQVELRYEQTETTGWSVTAKPPIGLESMESGSVSRKQLPLEVRQLVGTYWELIDGLSQLGFLCVCIDGLDNFEIRDKAYDFVRGLGPIFDFPGCYHILSLPERSESGLVRERVQLTDFVSTSLLTLSEANDMLRLRGVGMPITFAALCYCMSGGSRGELLYLMRTLVGMVGEDHRSITLKDGCERVISDYILSFVDELKETAETTTSLQEQDKLIEWIDKFRLAPWPLRASTLLDFCRSTKLAVHEPHNQEGVSQGVDEPLSIATARILRRAPSVCYFSATMLQFFSNGRGPSSWEEATETSGNRSIELLAQARHAVDGLSTNAIWAPLSKFRDAWRLEVLPAPEWVTRHMVSADSE